MKDKRHTRDSWLLYLMIGPIVAALLLWAASCLGLDLVVVNGQIFTPGLVILDAPQPGTPMGGDTIEIPLDISADGRLPLPPYDPHGLSLIYNITIFLYSYATGRNFTVTNGTASANNASLGDILYQESGSTVKHIKWVWPDCFVGNGHPTTTDSARGVYNISIHQNFRLNRVDHYTIFDMPISVTNEIRDDVARPSCDALLNPMLTPEQVNVTGANAQIGVLFSPGNNTVVHVNGNESGPDNNTAVHVSGNGSGPGNNTAVHVSGNGSGASSYHDGLGGTKPEAKPSDGLGAAGTVDPRKSASWFCVVGLLAAMAL